MNSGVERDILDGTYSKEFYSLERAREILELCDMANEKRELDRAFDFYFYEMRPLYLLAQILFPNDPQVRIKFTGGPGTDHDGLITHPTLDTEQKVEMVRAIDGHQEALKMEYMKVHGMVSLLDPVESTGPKHNRELEEQQTRA